MANVASGRRALFAKPSAVVAGMAAGLFLLAYWFFGWGYPSRFDLETFLSYGFIRNGTLDAFRGDGSDVKVDQATFGLPADISCRRQTYRRQPSIDYTCFYTSAGEGGSRYRLVILAGHNRGWKRNGLADVGDYRLSFPDAERQREIYATYGIGLVDARETGEP